MSDSYNRKRDEIDMLLYRRGVLRARQLLDLGLTKSDVETLVRRGRLQPIGLGLYASALVKATGDRGLAAAALRVPAGVVCLLSAAHLHGLVAERPAEVWMAVSAKAWRPRGLRIVWYSGAAFTEGIETLVIEGVEVSVYSAAKTVADCLKYRRKIGETVALAALHEFRQRHPEQVGELERFAAICRVTGVLRRYTLAA
jgi:predicted transcriptional regulator of viral defense system